MIIEWISDSCQCIMRFDSENGTLTQAIQICALHKNNHETAFRESQKLNRSFASNEKRKQRQEKFMEIKKIGKPTKLSDEDEM